MLIQYQNTIKLEVYLWRTLKTENWLFLNQNNYFDCKIRNLWK